MCNKYILLLRQNCIAVPVSAACGNYRYCRLECIVKFDIIVNYCRLKK